MICLFFETEKIHLFTGRIHGAASRRFRQSSWVRAYAAGCFCQHPGKNQCALIWEFWAGLLHVSVVISNFPLWFSSDLVRFFRLLFWVWPYSWGWRLSSLRSQKGNTALMLAAVKGNLQCARLLLDVGSDFNAKNNVRFGHNLFVLFWMRFDMRDLRFYRSLCQVETCSLCSKVRNEDVCCRADLTAKSFSISTIVAQTNFDWADLIWNIAVIRPENSYVSNFQNVVFVSCRFAMPFTSFTRFSCSVCACDCVHSHTPTAGSQIPDRSSHDWRRTDSRRWFRPWRRVTLSARDFCWLPAPTRRPRTRYTYRLVMVTGVCCNCLGCQGFVVACSESSMVCVTLMLYLPMICSDVHVYHDIFVFVSLCFALYCLRRYGSFG